MIERPVLGGRACLLIGFAFRRVGRKLGPTKRLHMPYSGHLVFSSFSTLKREYSVLFIWSREGVIREYQVARNSA